MQLLEDNVCSKSASKRWNMAASSKKLMNLSNKVTV